MQTFEDLICASRGHEVPGHIRSKFDPGFFAHRPDSLLQLTISNLLESSKGSLIPDHIMHKFGPAFFAHEARMQLNLRYWPEALERLIDEWGHLRHVDLDMDEFVKACVLSDTRDGDLTPDWTMALMLLQERDVARLLKMWITVVKQNKGALDKPLASIPCETPLSVEAALDVVNSIFTAEEIELALLEDTDLCFAHLYGRYNMFLHPDGVDFEGFFNFIN